jgi:hypothetical protein
MRDLYKGGAIYINIENNENGCKGCSFHFMGKNIFRNNYAAVEGGAIAIASQPFTEEKENYSV